MAVFEDIAPWQDGEIGNEHRPTAPQTSPARARCVCMLVANPRLFEPECWTPRQVQLANAFYRYVELARVVPSPARERARAEDTTE